MRVDSEGHVFSFQEGMVFVLTRRKICTRITQVSAHIKEFFQCPCHRIVINNKQEVVHI